MDWIWKSILLVLIGMFLLRIAGRKSISQMSVATTVIIISIGTTIVQPIANHELGKAIGSAAVFILTLLIVEQLQLKFNWFEKLMSGKSKVVVEDGKLNLPNLKRMRFSVDQLEMQLREKGITSIADLETATMEPNGQLGYVLKRHARPVTVGDLEALLKQGTWSTESNELFQEVIQDGHSRPIDSKIQ
ncbi:DUF421 domain-containing protein [Paenibacillus taichungensis]|uniref:DUF421 domain-containing protein n=1 Tax=Paenibacillus taichungensis TaxID=484184 RepID=A0ABX2MTR5_9BACL|nr:DUF421 domain-containing protein [Paenibacillus taichungensis]NUU57491.1 DUF421 domain-containing protein [Paenibacillus taichungensis]